MYHVCELRPRPDKRGFDLISDALPFRRLWYETRYFRTSTAQMPRSLPNPETLPRCASQDRAKIVLIAEW